MSQPAEKQETQVTDYEHARAAMMSTYAPPETVFVRGEGPYVYTEDNREYLDFFGAAYKISGDDLDTLEAAGERA